MKDICALCLKPAKLKMSHIVPKFVWRWLKEPLHKGVRSNAKPNQVIQDGIKTYLLCRDCEERISKWENLFSKKIYSPFHGREPVKEIICYGDWALKFAVSVSWRALEYMLRVSTTTEITSSQYKLINLARETWRKFLLGEVATPDNYTQHLIPVDFIENNLKFEEDEYLNRYLQRSININLIYDQKSIYVYTKINRLILFGCIQEKYPNKWKYTKLKLRKGEIRPRDYKLPPGIFNFLCSKADDIKKMRDSLSLRQKEIVDNEFYSSINPEVNSKILRELYASE